MNPFTKMAYLELHHERQGYDKRIQEFERVAACMLSDVAPSLDPAALEPLFTAEKKVLGKRKEYEYLPFTIHHDRACNKEVAENLREWERDYGPHEKMETRRAELTDDILRLKDAKKKDRESLEALRASWHRIFSRIVSFKNKEITALSQSIGLQADQIYEQQQELRKVEKHLARYKDIAQYHRTYEKMVENLRDSVWRRAKENPEFATMLIQDFGVLPGLKLVIEEVQRLAKLCKETGEAMHDTRTSSSAAYWDSVFYGR